MSDLIPREPKRKRQPTAECMRQQLALAADEIMRLRAMQPNPSFWRQLIDEIDDTDPKDLPEWARLIRFLRDLFRRKS